MLTRYPLYKRSAIPGRVRLKAPNLRHRPRRAASVEHVLQQTAGIRSVQVNPHTGSILVYYDGSLTQLAVEETAQKALHTPPLSQKAFLAVQKQKESEQTKETAPHEAPDHEHSHEHGDGESQERVRNLYLGGAVLGGLLVRRIITGSGIFVGNPLVFAVTTIATLITGYPFFRGAVRSLLRRSQVTTDTLVSSATLASVVLRENVTALTVIWLLNLGEHLQAVTLRRTRQAIRGLLSMEDEDVWLVVNETEMSQPLSTVAVGDLLAVYAGKRIPVDGVVESGSGTINEAPITGESVPVIRNVGDKVYAGTILLVGDVRIRTERVGDDTAVGRLIQRVEEAQELRAPIQTVGERFSARFVPLSFVLSAGAFVLTGDINRALTMLLIACPCAAGMATPTAVSAAIGNGARRGILIKGGTHLETAARLDTVVFDKTGTLTIGSPGVQRVIALSEDYSPDQVLTLAASGELHSQHPLALAVINHARDREIEIDPHDECEIIVGRGMHADWEGNCVLVGSRQLLKDFSVSVSDEAQQRYKQHTATGETVMYVGHQDRLVGLIGVRDKIRPEAATALKELRAVGIEHIVMLTGDNEETAKSVAHLVDLSEWRSSLLPDQKYEHIQSLRAGGHRVAMVGDGINDAPALALADVGIAMGTAGSDVAVETADVALAGDDIRHVATTIQLSRQTIRIIRQNYGMALGVNAGGILIGALGAINPFIAAVLHNLSTLLVVFNSARLIQYDPDA